MVFYTQQDYVEKKWCVQKCIKSKCVKDYRSIYGGSKVKYLCYLIVLQIFYQGMYSLATAIYNKTHSF